jgi:hypothetical protein
MTAMQNTCLAIVLIAAGGLRDATGSFGAMGVGLACLGGISALLGLVVVWQLDTRPDSGGQGLLDNERGESDRANTDKLSSADNPLA